MSTQEQETTHKWINVGFSYASWTECTCGYQPNSQNEMDTHINRENTDERNELFDDFLDENYPALCIGTLTFVASNVLYECDPIAYRCYLTNWEENQE
jgi:hypothetical protein